MSKPPKELFSPENMPGSAMWGQDWNSEQKTPLDSNYRYVLIREWKHHIAREHNLHGQVNFIMLNPSTATATEWDPTVRRCAGYAYDWGFKSLAVTNLFAYRTTDPEYLYHADRPEAEEIEGRADTDNASYDHNLECICRIARNSNLVVCAWGNHGQYKERGKVVLEVLERQQITPTALTVTKAGEPGYPLYLSADLKPQPINTFEESKYNFLSDPNRINFISL